MDSAYSRQYSTLWRSHWWWRARHRVVMKQLQLAVAPWQSQSIRPLLLDIGCGGGLAFDDFTSLTDVHGVEPDPELVNAVPRWRDRVHFAPFSPEYQDPDGRRYHIAVMLDVLEHLEDDAGCLRNVARHLQEDGRFICTVPALPSLWSRHDEVNRHYRRYRPMELYRRMSESGFEVESMRYLFGWSVPLVYARKWCFRANGQAGDRYQVQTPNALVNNVMAWLTHTEEWLVERTGWSIPMGSSLLAMGRRRVSAKNHASRAA